MLLIINILLCKQPIEGGQRWHDILGTVIIGEAFRSDLLIFQATTGNLLNLLLKKRKNARPLSLPQQMPVSKILDEKKREMFLQQRRMGIDAEAFLHREIVQLHFAYMVGRGADNLILQINRLINIHSFIYLITTNL